MEAKGGLQLNLNITEGRMAATSPKKVYTGFSPQQLGPGKKVDEMPPWL